MRNSLMLLMLVLIAASAACGPSGNGSQPATPSKVPTAIQPLPTAAAARTALAAPPPTASAATRPAEPGPRRLQLTATAPSASLKANLGALAIDRYVVSVTASQKLSVKVTGSQGSIIFSVAGADGNVLKSTGVAAPAGWSTVVPTTQDYLIGVNEATGAPGAYTLDVSVGP